MQQENSNSFILNSTIDQLVSDSLLNTFSMFQNNYPQTTPNFIDSSKLKLKVKIHDEYPQINPKEQSDISKLSDSITDKLTIKKPLPSLKQPQDLPKTGVSKLIEEVAPQIPKNLEKIPKQFLIKPKKTPIGETYLTPETNTSSSLSLYKEESPRISGILSVANKKTIKPDWHAPWKLMRVISGHQGWVRAVAVDPSNSWFATGSTDRTIKIWDMVSGQLKLTLTGHINTVRGLAVSERHMYLFSCGEDKTVRCWDLEYNKIIRNYHGHLSGVYCLALHPTLDLVMSGGRDSTCRIWDIRTRSQVHTLSGHSHVVSSIISQEFEPQVVSGSHDSTVRLWDIGMGRSISTLTNHKKAVRGLVFHHSEYTFVSAAHDNVKVWKCPEGEFLRNVSGHDEILNCLALNKDNVLVGGGDKGNILNLS